MDIPPKALTPTKVFDPASSRAALEAAGKKLHDAATEWGIRPTDPDTILISAHLDAQKVGLGSRDRCGGAFRRADP